MVGVASEHDSAWMVGLPEVIEMFLSFAPKVDLAMFDRLRFRTAKWRAKNLYQLCQPGL
jgi:hypothetical protein